MQRLVTVLVALCLIAHCVLPALALAEETATLRQGRINADRLNVREGAGTQFPVVGAATRGDAVVILEESQDWYRVRLADGRTGWVAARYVEIVATTPAEAPEGDDEAPRSDAAQPAETRARRSGGGSLLRPVLKWACFFGAAACGGLAYNEHSLGNDSYDQYKDLVLKEGKTPAEAEFRRQEAIDHDDKATTFAIAGGALFGAFLLQQLFLGGGGDDQASLVESEPRLALGLSERQLRAGVVVARF